MEGSLDEVLSGIDLSLNKKESKYRELATLKQFDAQLESEQKKEQESQLAYQKYEESINVFSESLLENDRNKIRQLHQQSKSFIRDQIQANGGSYKKFMSSGGLRVMGNYRDSIVNSDESIKYKDNAKNMASIMKARDSGKSSLILEKDLFNLKKYETEGGGDITYSGLLSPIEKIDQNAYALGQKVNANDILKFSNNHSAILGNYMREHPDEGVPSEQTLIKYTNKRYGAVGKNVGLLNAMNRKNLAKNSLRKDKDTYSIYSQYRKVLKTVNENADNTVGFTIDSTGEENYKRGVSSNSRLFSNKRFTTVSETEIDSPWYNLGSWNNDVSNTRPRYAYESSAFNGSISKASKDIYSKYYNPKSNDYTFPSSDLIGAHGNRLEPGERHTVRPKTVIMAQVGLGVNHLSNNKTPEEFIAIEFSDEKGHLNTIENKRYNNQLKDSNGNKTQLQYKAVEVWEDKKGYLFYKIMDTEGISNQAAYSASIQEQDDVTSIIHDQKVLVKEAKRSKEEQEYNKTVNQKRINNIYNNKDFSYNVYKNLVINNKLPDNPDIFQSMIIGMGRAMKKRGENISLNSNDLSTVAEHFEIPMSSLTGLRDSNLTIEKAYINVRNGMMSEAENKEDIQQINDFLSYWKSSYESKTKKKLNFKK